MPVLPKPSIVAEFGAAKAYAGPWRWNRNGVRLIDTAIGDWRVIGFEGTTKDGAQILRDIRFAPWWSQEGGIGPAGFVKGAQLVSEAVIADTIDDAKAGRLLICGHSLGGSLALRLASHFRDVGYRVPTFAFDPARAGLLKLASVLGDVKVFISANADSPVPDVPLFYMHPAKVVRIGHRDRWFWQRLLRLRGDIGDHRISAIIESLKAAGL